MNTLEQQIQELQLLETKLLELQLKQGGGPVIIPSFIILRAYYAEDTAGNIMYHTEQIQEDLDYVLETLEEMNETSDFNFDEF